ncbi:MAG: haloacid dehalogenase-like hydrolase [Methyloceanibacter sp.]|uniref:haloacid dehalogenase-like hydrolase n=1 Tax=Methyloceanibacter sp. TaxID=1965321 RepID=UPI003D6CE3CE
MADITSSLPGAASTSLRSRRSRSSHRVAKAVPKTAALPLVVDLDGTLIRSDLLIESAFAHLGQNPLRILGLLSALFRGKAALKAHIAKATAIDVTGLPYDESVLALIRDARAEGRPVYLVSASNERYVSAVAAHLGVFDGWFASDSSENLSSAAKADRLVSVFGGGGFDYLGNGEADLAVWKVARRCLAIRASAAVRAKLLEFAPDATLLISGRSTLRAWA